MSMVMLEVATSRSWMTDQYFFMKVSSAVLQPLLGQHHEDDISFHALCSEAGMAESKRS